MKDSTIIKGELIQHEPNKFVVIKKDDGNLYNLPAESIDYMIEDESMNPDFLTKDYTDFGLTIGSPAVFNLVFCRWIGQFGVRLSGMYYGFFDYENLWGFQGELCLKILDTKKWTHSISVAYGKYPDYYSRYLGYFGVAYTINLHGIYLQGGTSYWFNYNEGLLPLFQIGYVYRFR